MSEIVTTFESYIKKLENFQNNDKLKQNEIDLALLEDILLHLKKAIKDKNDDWQIAYSDLIDVQYKCVPFPNNAKLSRIAYDELVRFCDKHTQMRKELSHQVLNYILYVQYPAYQIQPFHPNMIELLATIFGKDFQSHIYANTFATLLDEIVKSNLLSNIELRNWVLFHKRVGVADWHESVSQVLSHIPKKHFNYHDAQLTAIDRERLTRRNEYKKKLSRLTQSMPVLPVKVSILPNEESLAHEESLPEIQIIKCKSVPLLFRQTKKQKPLFLQPDQPTVSGSRAISEEDSLSELSRGVMQVSIQEEYPQESRDLSRDSILEGERESRFARKKSTF
ncbi:hypothetical protein [Candidatus Berkiella aquae]|uniref:Uncharacterized protein n=1 Tax=Candidatus Berkiella aquae TaxID=295108 RepID=A0A0Q9YM48_9GAMM|nr:hypothetical protein [Candidatus Berkiella aquae]MCS5710505.1 hypothetical protein [Candidatus Berkiella aquae]